MATTREPKIGQGMLINGTATTETDTHSLHDALPRSNGKQQGKQNWGIYGKQLFGQPPPGKQREATGETNIGK